MPIKDLSDFYAEFARDDNPMVAALDAEGAVVFFAPRSYAKKLVECLNAWAHDHRIEDLDVAAIPDGRRTRLTQ